MCPAPATTRRPRRAAAADDRLQLLWPRAGDRRIRDGGPARPARSARRCRPPAAPRRLGLLGRRARPRPWRDRRQDHRPARLRPYRQGDRRARQGVRDGGRSSPTAARCRVSDLVDRSFTLDELADFWGAADFIVVSVPLTPETDGHRRRRRLRARCGRRRVALNVGRGPTIDEAALYEALQRAAHRRRGHRHLVSLSRAGASPSSLPSALPVSRAAERRDDAAHVGLDQRHHPPPPADHRRQHQALRARRGLHERRAAASSRSLGTLPASHPPIPARDARACGRNRNLPRAFSSRRFQGRSPSASARARGGAT